MGIPPKARRKVRSERRRARLAAVQALYQIELVAVSPEQAAKEFTARNEPGAAMDVELFSHLVQGAASQAATIDRLVSEHLGTGWRIDRLSVTARALLRAATFELRTLADVPARVTISEYVDIARRFFAESETGFVNGVLDRLARACRPEEWADSAARARESPDGGPTA